MNKLENVKKYFYEKRKLFLGASMIVAFLAVLVLSIVLNVSKAQALETITVSNEHNYVITSDNMDITLEVIDGKYIIDGGGALRNNVSINIQPENENITNVEIVLKNVNIQNSLDIPVIQFNAATADKITSYTLSVEGDCRLESTREGAKSAVISVQSVSVSIIKLMEYKGVVRVTKLSDILTETEVKYASELKITNNPGTTGTLTLVTAKNSYGAAIGSNEANSDIELELSEGDPSQDKVFNPQYLLREDGSSYDTPQNAFDYLNEKYNTNYSHDTVLQQGKEFFLSSTVDAGDVTIDGDVEINIKGQGYGAGIGGGGSETAAKASGRAGIVTLNAGTVAVNMLSAAPCIGSGRNSAGGNVSNGNNIIIEGGSLYMNAAVTEYDATLQDSKGNKLYLFEVDLTDDGTKPGFSVEHKEYSIDISDNRYMNTYLVDVESENKHATAKLSGLNYRYAGWGHENISDIGIDKNKTENMLYFYLPATPTAELTILPDSYISTDQNIEVYWKKANGDREKIEKNPENRYVLAAEQNAELRIYDVPNQIKVSGVTIGNQTYPVTKTSDDTNDYYLLSFLMPSTATTALVNYDGEIDIVYRDGFSENDADISNHGYVAPDVTVYKYGTSISLQAPAITDLVFDGWYITGTDTKITDIKSVDVISSDILIDGKIDLTAKWKSVVSYVYYINNQEKTITTAEYPYGSSYLLDPNTINIELPNMEIYDFKGWSVPTSDNDSYICSIENRNTYFDNSLTSNLKITALYARNRYYIYVDKTFFDAAKVDLMMGSSELTFSEDEYTENGITYRKALVTEAAGSVTLNIAAKLGYEISSDSLNVSISNASDVSENWNDNFVSYEMGLGDDDIYVVNNNSKFIPKTYTITFYDGINKQKPWKVVEYTVESMELPRSIKDILGDDAEAIKTKYGKAYEFLGWKANTGLLETDPYVTNVDTLGNYIFVGVWEWSEAHPLDITVYDEYTGNVCDYIGAIPYLYDITSGVKTPIEAIEIYDEETGVTKNVIYVVPGDNVYIELVALDSAGNYMKNEDGSYKVIEIGKGITFAKIEDAPNDYTIRYRYESKNLEDAIKKIRANKQYITVPDDVNVESDISVDVRIKLTQFTIQYWDLRGYETSNPNTYTIFDEFDFKPLLENVGWHLVVSDKDDTNYDDVTTTPITGINKWSTGNLVLKADWQYGYTGFYNINILVDNDEKGIVEIISPSEDGYREKQSIFLSVQCEKGYRLKSNSLVYTKVNSLEAYSLLSRNIRAVELPVIIAQVNEAAGLYLFMMPGSDIEITAEFELEVYNINYNDMDEGVINRNPVSYTIEDEIILTAPVREGYIFKGWRDENGNIVTKIKNGVGDIDLTPSWEAVSQDNTTADKDYNSKDDNKNDTNGEDETTKNMFIGSGSLGGGQYVQTGDNTNIIRLVLILVCAAVILLFVVIKTKKNNDNDDEENQDISNEHI